jgi:formylglycine-generating enzyme required for sulfatase activity
MKKTFSLLCATLMTAVSAQAATLEIQGFTDRSTSGGDFWDQSDGSWNNNHQDNLRCSNRNDNVGSHRSINYGFRLVLSR